MIDEMPNKVLIAQAIWAICDAEERREAIIQYLNKSYPNYRPLQAERPFVLCERRG
jgi:uncharacterized protein YbdZ (MbtH family)